MPAIESFSRRILPLSALLATFWLAFPALAAEGSEASSDTPAPSERIIAPEDWHDSLEAAQREAREGDKKIIVNLYATWCGWCRRLDQQVFASPGFAELSEDFVLLKLDVDEDRDAPRLQRRTRTSGVPVTLVLTADLDPVTAISGFLPVDRFIGRVEDAVESFDRRRAAPPRPEETSASAQRSAAP